MIQICRDTSDATALYLPQRLYLKPFAKLNISVQLPTHKVHGKAISNWELMEKLRKMIQPECFSVLKVSKHTSEVIRFDAELECRDKLDKVLSRLDDRVVQLNDFPDPLRVRVSEAKSDFPSRHSWDSFFRDAPDMDEMKPGERPDTVHIVNLPIRWFVHERDKDEDAPPSESIFRKVFDKFGEIRQIDIPAADPFRLQMKSAIRGVTIPPQDSALYFEGYVQFGEYVGFVRCMDALRNHKLLRKKDDIAEWCSIKVDFDKTKHMTDAAVKRRAIVRERLIARQRAKEEEERNEKEKISKKEAKERMRLERVEHEKLQRMREREERRKKKHIARMIVKDNVDLDSVAAQEEIKLLKVQKKLQAIRLMEEIFNRIELRSQLEQKTSRQERYYRTGDISARQRMVEKMKKSQEELVDSQRERLRQALDGRLVIRSALETRKPKPHASSTSSEDEDRRYKRIKTEKLSTPERETEYKKYIGLYGMAPPYGFGYPFAPMPSFPFPQTSMFYGGGVQGAYYPPPPEYAPRRPYRGPYRGRGRGRGRGRPYEHGSVYEHDDRDRARSRSRRRSYSRSRSRSRRRSRSRSRSRRRTHSRSHSRGRRSRSRRSRSRHSRSRSRRRSRSRSRRKTKSRSKSKPRTPPAAERASVDSSKFVSPGTMRRRDRSKSWSLPKEGENQKAWSTSPKDKQ